ncbi:MAG: exodeoxyribonuclease VII large subunit [Betaproteobacteria bacterium]|nr:exodeoxyribonuclease VII large subunit [Betaproteobacteria bacterium]
MLEEPYLARVSTGSPGEILSVSALNRSVRDLLEHRYPLLWVAGEISNLTIAKSGHAYFSLKDDQAQVRCVMFRHRLQYLDWSPREGMMVEVQALVTLYEPRGDFQLNLETMRRAGRGALFDAYLRLRDRLQKEGLFDQAAKRPLPAYPRAVGVLTSLQAAALRDVLSTLARRNPSIGVVIYPVPVQGEGAAAKIAATIELAGARGDCDVLLLARGGGSIEDLWAFNEEIVARAIRASALPVVTGIGHETDFTIADFAADMRAHTPTAAAELLSPDRAALLARISSLAAWLHHRALREIETRMQLLDHLARRLEHPAERLRMQREALAQLKRRLSRSMTHALEDRGRPLEALAHRGRMQLPRVAELQRLISALALRLKAGAHALLERAATRIGAIESSLDHLDPLRVLERGYSVVSRADGSFVREGASLAIGETLSLRFARGGAKARVESKDS